MDHYRITRHPHSGIVNDPNDWFDDPRDLIPAFCRIVRVRVVTVSFIEGLSKSLDTEVQ